MFKLISGLVASLMVLAPSLPARANFGVQSSRFGVSIVTPSTSGFPVGVPYNTIGTPYNTINAPTLNVPYNTLNVPFNTLNVPYNTINAPFNAVDTPFNNNYEAYRNRVYRQGPVSIPYPSNVYPSGFYSPSLPSSGVIVAPNVRTVIVNPGYNNYIPNYSPNCGSVIYGSPIPAPVSVNPFTGLACR